MSPQPESQASRKKEVPERSKQAFLQRKFLLQHIVFNHFQQYPTTAPRELYRLAQFGTKALFCNKFGLFSLQDARQPYVGWQVPVRLGDAGRHGFAPPKRKFGESF